MKNVFKVVAIATIASCFAFTPVFAEDDQANTTDSTETEIVESTGAQVDETTAVSDKNAVDETATGEEKEDDEIAVTYVTVAASDTADKDSILVQLYRNGEAYGDPIELNSSNFFCYTFFDLPVDGEYTVKEVNPSDGYDSLVDGSAFKGYTIYHQKKPDVPETPETPEKPETPDVPDTPETPETPVTPETPEIPETPDVPETPETPEAPETPVIPEETTEAHVTEAPSPVVPVTAAEEAVAPRAATPNTGVESHGFSSVAAIALALALVMRKMRK